MLLLVGCSSHKKNDMEGTWITYGMEQSVYDDELWEFNRNNVRIIDQEDRSYEGQYDLLQPNKVVMKLEDKSGDRRNGFATYQFVEGKFYIKVREDGREQYSNHFNEEEGYDVIVLMKVKR